MSRCPFATWRGPIPNQTVGGITRPILGLVLHIEQGTEAGTSDWFHNPGAQASAHFGNPKSGGLDQWVDTNDRAWAECQGNSRWVSVEHEGFSGDSLTAGQLENDAELLAWLHRTEGVPLQVSSSPGVGGLGHHAMGGISWCDHPDCPGGPIIAQKAAIVARAVALVGGPAPSPTPAPGPSNPYVPLSIDGGFGPLTVEALQWVLGAVEDGVFGPNTKMALQRHLRVLPDGVIGAVTIRALQARVGAWVDGVWGALTTRALQLALNQARF